MRKQFESIWSWLTCVMFRAADVGTLTRSDHTNHRCQSTNRSNIALAFKWLLVNGIVNDHDPSKLRLLHDKKSK